MKTTFSLLAATLGLTAVAQLHAAPVPVDHSARHTDHGLVEIPDAQLANMRGRYTGDNNTVAYFGVKMISTWQTQSGQVLQAAMNMAINAVNNNAMPTVTFQPTVNITSPLPTTTSTNNTSSGTTERSADGSGLANTTGLTQGVQVAGDQNQAVNVTDMSVAYSNSSSSTGNTPTTGSTATAPSPSTPQTQSITVGDATVTSSASPDGIQLLLSIANQGSVQQWIHNGSVGQTVQLTSDMQKVSNHMEISLLMRGNLNNNVQLAQSFARSLGQIRSAGGTF